MKKRFIKAIPAKGMYVPEKVNTSTGVYDFGLDNMLPNKLMKWVLSSGIAKKAQQKRAVYIAADGFVDEMAAKLKVNDTQTADELLYETAGYVSYFKGFAWHVQRDGASNITSIKVLPFQDIRKKVDGNLVYNPTLSTTAYKKDKDQTVSAFKGFRKLNTDELAQILEYGEILYAYTRTADNSQYPIPDYYAGIEDLRTSSELQKFDYETVLNGFIPSAVMTYIGALDDETKDNSGRTEKDYFEENLQQFTGNSSYGDGGGGRNKLLVVTAATKDEAPIITPFDAKAIFESSNAKRDLIDRIVSRLFGVNPVLVGMADSAILGNQQALANASNELNNDVLGDQSLISAAFKMVFPNFDWLITTLRPIQYVPDAIMGELTGDEKRALVGYAPLPANLGGSEKLLSERLGVGGTQSLVGIISDTTLSIAQKRNAIRILFGISEVDAALLVPDTTISTPNPVAP